MDRYEDIINLPHPVSRRHPPMSREARAAQFAPFAALTGYDAAVRETARLTDQAVELNEEEISLLNRKLAYLRDHAEDERFHTVTITYFCPDERKSGGAYVRAEGSILSIDETAGIVELTDHTRIHMEAILAIDTDGFMPL